MADSVQKELEAERLATLYSTLGPELTARMMSDKEPSPEDLAQFMKLLGGEAEGREDSLLESLMAGSSASADPSAVSSAEIDPIPGFVVKTLLLERKEGWVSGLKVFINISHSPYIPSPPLVSDEDLKKALSAADNVTYKVPLSLAGPVNDLDKSGNACIVFDACCHTSVLEKCVNDIDYKMFIIELAIEWVENKHQVKLSREFILPKMKTKGRMQKHVIKRAKKPFIAEVERGSSVGGGDGAGSKQHPLKKPKYTIQGRRIKIDLPDVTSTKDATLDIEKNLVIFQLPNRYYLEIPFNEHTIIDVDHTSIDAFFQKVERVLYVDLIFATKVNIAAVNNVL